ncbi:hypothetical protein CC85DRAFT_300876 [Cutaneotrichosporon oleaginosum]|uniref:Cyanovirin-N domain-containing protein n=1 Tax=Cutaneotrichosporon oleaginosum TaxID=879819 RepID=A0A0J1B860_9TREE|nr:uncharacterized protein CC85DRAFT_300876 [Cutaneotrichosporon oleaginosum]KLT43954.1 hypothetical protein CC85DRAFT_300876 [Cutaneotrichosporon oleaginosum]TXT04099.1 hypothetical protein COLE_07796 [Cutaneotrichosporon oleaginosum]
MRYFPVLVLLLAFVTLASGRPRGPTPAAPLRLARSNREALVNNLPLPRPASIPMRCDRSNTTCIEELRKPRRKAKRQNPSATVIPALTANYQQTCNSVRLSSTTNPTLQANCKTQTGAYNPGASFRLSQCVSFGAQGLQCNWRPAVNLFQNFCSNCRLEGTVLVCECGTLFVNTHRTDLSACVANEDGELACRTTRGV